ncbi:MULTISPECIES: hypothetical protein [Paenibacillus]|uniref:hypothetical protein n=1 Tax=Paenibacillus TaxID=44249 RepID=UPI000A68D98D|nr:hypothetical protein [Paenibacillus polymyxa]MCH6190866.1 hypothetical protein [Paenibacillus polymyxa]WRL59677.1 hypothetical protein U3G77_16165 [Paenibacillus polymyxa]
MNREAKLQAKDRLLELAMSKLSSIQREVIQRSYLDDEESLITLVAGKWGLARARLGGSRSRY